MACPTHFQKENHVLSQDHLCVSVYKCVYECTSCMNTCVLLCVYTCIRECIYVYMCKFLNDVSSIIYVCSYLYLFIYIEKPLTACLHFVSNYYEWLFSCCLFIMCYCVFLIVLCCYFFICIFLYVFNLFYIYTYKFIYIHSRINIFLICCTNYTVQ